MEIILTPDIVIIAIAGGLVAGFINTLAGNGSAITLTILTELIGLPGNLANGTNRIGILLQCLASIFAFQRHGRIDWRKSALPVGIALLGAIAGVLTALRVSNEQFMDVFRYLMVVMLIILLVKPSRWIHVDEFGSKLPRPVQTVLLLMLGFYGGFIQMGMGIYLLAFFVLGTRMNLISANVLKILMVGVYTVFVLILFAGNGLVHWQVGGLIGIGQLAGGWATAHYAMRWRQAEKVAYVVLVVMVVAAIVKLFLF